LRTRLAQRRVLALLATLLATLLLGAAQPVPDAERIRRLLPGRWQADTAQGELTVKATSDYGRDGFVVYAGHISGPGVDFSYRVRSRWTVAGDVLSTEIVESDQPQVLAPGSRKQDRVLAIDARRFRYRDAAGAEFEEVRLPAR
jgi:hypothetical protein